jgi:hypothetical protein
MENNIWMISYKSILWFISNAFVQYNLLSILCIALYTYLDARSNARTLCYCTWSGKKKTEQLVCPLLWSCPVYPLPVQCTEQRDGFLPTSKQPGMMVTSKPVGLDIPASNTQAVGTRPWPSSFVLPPSHPWKVMGSVPVKLLKFDQI